MSYISELQIDGGAVLPVASSLYGVCDTAVGTYAKVVTLSTFDTLINGVTVHVKFTNGNSAPLINPSNNTETLTLKVGSTNAQQITNPGGSINWSAGAVISFTYDGTGSTWIVNDSDSGQQVTIDNTYSASSTNAISGQGVADALDDLGAASNKGVDTTIPAANPTDDNVPTSAAVAAYVNGKTAGLTGAMHYVGRTTTTMSDGLTTATVTINGTSYTPNPGDVVLSGDHQEYIWTETNSTTHAGYWELLGDEGSYALKTSTEDVIKTATFTPDVPGALTTKNTSIPNVTSAGTAATFSVASGVLSITTGAAPTLGTAITIKEVDTWTAGSAASLNTTTQTVVVPDSNS